MGGFQDYKPFNQRPMEHHKIQWSRKQFHIGGGGSSDVRCLAREGLGETLKILLQHYDAVCRIHACRQ